MQVNSNSPTLSSLCLLASGTPSRWNLWVQLQAIEMHSPCSQLLSFAAAHGRNVEMSSCMQKWTTMQIHTEEFNTAISF